jgi:hypothetical protein
MNPILNQPQRKGLGIIIKISSGSGGLSDVDRFQIAKWRLPGLRCFILV